MRIVGANLCIPVNRWQAGGMQIRPLEDIDRADWERLYAGYADFYATPLPDLDVVWRMIRAGEVECLVVVLDGQVVALAHLTEFPRVLDGGRGGYLQDLFVDPAFRGRGVADRMLAHVGDLARGRGWTLVRWITAADNGRAQQVYDRHATRTTWVTYDLRP